MADQSKEKKLNPEQKKAIEHGDGPLLIIAGAGTGKTTVVTERITRIISQGLAKPSEILALTFTEKAAREMEERVDQVMPYGYTQMWISTFHAFADRVLRQDGLHIGLNGGYQMMTEAQAVMFFRKHLFSFDLDYFRPLGNPTKFIEGMLQHFARLKDEDVTPDQYSEWVNSRQSAVGSLPAQAGRQVSEEEKIDQDKYTELAKTYKKYESLKVKHGVMDFGDLISNALLLFRKRPNVLREYQRQFKYMLIDEFQDTNFAQNKLAVLLAGEQKNITVVGDDDQAVYRWRGAAISNIIQFKQRFPTANIVVLTKNYRSSQRVLDASYKLVQHNNPDRLEVKESIDKRLISVRGMKGEPVTFIRSQKSEDEADAVAKKIREIKTLFKNDDGTETYRWKDFAILVRANNHADAFVQALSRVGIPYQFLGPGRLFRQSEVLDLIAYLNVLNDYTDTVSLFRVLSMDIFHLDGRDVQTLLQFSKKIGLTLFEGLEVISANHRQEAHHWSASRNYGTYLPALSDGVKETVSTLVTLVHRHMNVLQQQTAGQILFDFLQGSGLLESFTSYQTPQDERRALNISKFFERLKAFEVQYLDASVRAVVDWIAMSLEMGESPQSAGVDWSETDAVNILTIHASKGLEFPVVFVVNLVSQRFPTSERREKIPIPDGIVKEILPEGDYHLQEERRLCYVAMTRARDQLFLTAAKFYGDGIREKKLSPFIVEALGEQAVKQADVADSGVKQLTLLQWQPAKPEVEVPLVKTPLSYLSYSQIDTFVTCPLQYKYRYILKIPAPAAAAASFGTSMHAALQRFYEQKKQGGSPTKEDLLSLLDTVWIPVGYETQEYEQKMKQRGRRMIEGFFDKAYDPAVTPDSLEQVFKIKLSPQLVVGGKIDRIDRRPDGKMVIVDYKTGKRPTDKDIKENLQMTVYAMAATDPGIYGKKPEEVILTFYFFDVEELVPGTRTQEQLVAAREKLLGIADTLSTSDFKPTPGPWCGYCDYRVICPAAWK